MHRIAAALLLMLAVWTLAGCTSFPAKPDSPALLEWAGKSNGDSNNGKDDKKDNESKEDKNDNQAKEEKKDNGANNGEQNNSNPEDDFIKTDRPTFTNSSTTIGKDHIQLETGYTFTHVGPGVNTHTFPEANLRIGGIADWIEGRIGINAQGLNSDSQSQVGIQDLLLGVKLALTKQKGIMPESALILQSTVPTGSGFLTEKQMCPGINYLFSWEVLKDTFSVSGSVLANRVLDPSDHYYVEFGHSLVLDYSFSKRLDAFGEWYALYPSGAVDPATLPSQNFDSGLIYKLTNNVQLDIRFGVGRNNHANDYFSGAGVSVRY